MLAVAFGETTYLVEIRFVITHQNIQSACRLMNRDELLNPFFYWLRAGDFKIFATGLSLLLFRLGVFFKRAGEVITSYNVKKISTALDSG